MPPKQPMDPERQLMIKAKVCQRIRKELEYYIQEVKDNEAQLVEMKENNKDPFDIKKFEEVLGESRMMVPDSQRRLKEAVEDLKHYLETNEHLEGEWKATSLEILQSEHVALGTEPLETDTTTTATTSVENLKEGEAF